MQCVKLKLIISERVKITCPNVSRFK